MACKGKCKCRCGKAAPGAKPAGIGMPESKPATLQHRSLGRKWLAVPRESFMLELLSELDRTQRLGGFAQYKCAGIGDPAAAAVQLIRELRERLQHFSKKCRCRDIDAEVRCIFKDNPRLSNSAVARMLSISPYSVRSVRMRAEADGSMPVTAVREDANGRKMPARSNLSENTLTARIEAFMFDHPEMNCMDITRHMGLKPAAGSGHAAYKANAQVFMVRRKLIAAGLLDPMASKKRAQDAGYTQGLSKYNKQRKESK